VLAVSIPALGTPEFAVVDGHGRVYYPVEDKNELAVVDAQTLQIQRHYSLAPCGEPSALAIDPKCRLYPACRSGVMVVSDPTQGRVIGQSRIGHGANGVAWLDGKAYRVNGRARSDAQRHALRWRAADGRWPRASIKASSRRCSEQEVGSAAPCVGKQSLSLPARAGVDRPVVRRTAGRALAKVAAVVAAAARAGDGRSVLRRTAIFAIGSGANGLSPVSPVQASGTAGRRMRCVAGRSTSRAWAPDYWTPEGPSIRRKCRGGEPSPTRS
jgi:hypothetical protein